MVSEMCLSEALLESGKEVFETMIFMSMAESSDAAQKIEGDAILGAITFLGTYPLCSGGVCGSDGVKTDSGNKIEGILTICSNMSCAKAIAANMLGADCSKNLSETEVCDAIGEVTNMIMGGMKSRVQDRFSNIKVSIPSVITGQELHNSPGMGANKILVKVNIEDRYIAEMSFSCRLRCHSK
jgi:chemotaxis protein CheX